VSCSGTDGRFSATGSRRRGSGSREAFTATTPDPIVIVISNQLQRTTIRAKLQAWAGFGDGVSASFPLSEQSCPRSLRRPLDSDNRITIWPEKTESHNRVRNGGREQIPRGVKERSKRERQYEHIKDSYVERGV